MDEGDEKRLEGLVGRDQVDRVGGSVWREAICPKVRYEGTSYIWLES